MISFLRLLLLSALTFVLSQSPSLVSARDVSHLEHWRWLALSNNVKSTPEEIVSYFDQHFSDTDLTTIDWLPDEWAPFNPSKAMFQLATASRRLGDPRAVKFLHHAEEYAEKLIQLPKPVHKIYAARANRHFLRDALQDAEIDLIYQTAGNMRSRVKRHIIDRGMTKDDFGTNGSFDPHHLSDQNETLSKVAVILGDYVKAEEFIRSEISVKKVQAERLMKMSGGGLEWGLKNIYMLHYPKLASVLTKQGKAKEAAQVLDEYFSFKKAQPKTGTMAGAMALFGNMDSISLKPLAETKLALGAPEEALQVLEHAREADRAVRNKLNKFTSGAKVKRLGNTLAQMEKFSEADILEIAMLCHWKLGQLDELKTMVSEYRQIYELLPDSHPDIMASRRLKIWALLAEGEVETAAIATRQYAADQFIMIEETFRYAGERQRLALLQNIDPFSLLVATGNDDLLFNAIVALKGVVLDSVLEDQRSVQSRDNGETARLVSELDDARRRASQALVSGDKNTTVSARKDIDHLEIQLSRTAAYETGSREALKVSVEEIQSALSTDETVLEYIRYKKLIKPGKTGDHYGVAVIPTEGDPVWIDLGKAAEIDANITAFKQHMSPIEGQFDDAGIKSVLEALYSQLLSPVEDAIGSATKIFLSPDSELSTLAFSVLLDGEERFAAEKWNLAFVSTSRDLLKQSFEPSGKSSLFIVANPDFTNETDTEMESVDLASRAVRFDVSEIPPLAPLPGTQQELESISAIAGKLNATVTAISRGEARESALGQWDTSPTYLHFATHGLILPPVDSVAITEPTQTTGNFATADNALQRSMLALAGATSTFNQWKKGIAPDSRDDGLLNAAEVAGLNLESTWITVLSACDTGTGKALSGEGIFGLRRGFLMAGANHLVMTFWPIADQQTVEIMTNFYLNLAKGALPTDALHDAQVTKLKEWREQEGLGIAVYLAGPFAISTSGSQ